MSGVTPARASRRPPGATTLADDGPGGDAEHSGLPAGAVGWSPPRLRPAACGCRPATAAAPGSGRSTGMKLVSPPQRGTTCWCRWAAMPAPATEPWFMPMLNPCGAADRADRPHRRLGERAELGDLARVRSV